MFIELTSQQPSWPAVLSGAIEEFYRSVYITDPEDSDPAMVSRNFMACKFVKLAGTPGNMLNRADFIDLLIRVARSKYYDP